MEITGAFCIMTVIGKCLPARYCIIYLYVCFGELANFNQFDNLDPVYSLMKS